MLLHSRYVGNALQGIEKVLLERALTSLPHLQSLPHLLLKLANHLHSVILLHHREANPSLTTSPPLPSTKCLKAANISPNADLPPFVPSHGKGREERQPAQEL